MANWAFKTWAVLFQSSACRLVFRCFFWLVSSRNQMLTCAQVLQLKDLRFSKDVVFLFMFKCSAWLCITKLAESWGSIREGCVENRNVQGLPFIQQLRVREPDRDVPAAIDHWFGEPVFWEVCNWEKISNCQERTAVDSVGICLALNGWWVEEDSLPPAWAAGGQGDLFLVGSLVLAS